MSDYNAFCDIWNDEFTFWKISEESKLFPSYKNLIVDCFIYKSHNINEGYIFYIQSIAYYANKYLDGNSLLLQFCGSALPLTFIVLPLYSILEKYKVKDASYFVLFYVFLTPLFPEACKLYRDPLISLLYSYVLYYIICGHSIIKVIIVPSIIAFITYWFRSEHGLFMVLLIIIGAYCRFIKYKWLFLSLGIVCLVFLVGYIHYFTEAIIDVDNKHGEFTNSQIFDSNVTGFARYIHLLPSPLKEIAQTINSQFLPFPPWKDLLASSNLFNFIINIFVGIASIAWIRVSSFAFIAIIKKKVHVDKMLKYLYLVFVLFLVLNTANMSIRRIICMYPIPFITFTLFQQETSNIDCIKWNKRFSLIVVSLCLLYILMKGGF